MVAAGVAAAMLSVACIEVWRVSVVPSATLVSGLCDGKRGDPERYREGIGRTAG